MAAWFDIQDLAGCNPAADLCPVSGAFPTRWCCDNSTFLVVMTQICAGKEISPPLGTEWRQQLRFPLLTHGKHHSHRVFPGSSAALQGLGYSCWRAHVWQQKVGFSSMVWFHVGLVRGCEATPGCFCVLLYVCVRQHGNPRSFLSSSNVV